MARSMDRYLLRSPDPSTGMTASRQIFSIACYLLLASNTRGKADIVAIEVLCLSPRNPLMASSSSESSTARQLNDVESRLWLQTRTQSNHHWDQVLGVSQRVINAQFEHLFDLYPEMKVMYNSADTVGTLDAQLLPPRVIIPGGTSAERRGELIFLLRFEGGYLLDGNDNPLIDDLSNWQIACPVTVHRKRVTITDAMTEKQKEQARKENDWIDHYDVAGDYSIERMFAKLSSIRWSSPDPDFTICGLGNDGKPISWGNWSSEDPNRSLRLNVWLAEWSIQQDAAGRNNIGVAIQLHPPKDEIQATYAPIYMMNQTYPYISIPQGLPEGGTSENGPATCNAYLYTEMVHLPGRDDSLRPDEHNLIWSGNFCTVPVDGKASPDGSFLFGRRVFMEAFLLTQLKPLLYAFDLSHEQPYSDQAEDGPLVAHTEIKFSGAQSEPSAGDQTYDFVNLNPHEDPSLPNGFRWSKRNGPFTLECVSRNRFGDLRITVEDEVVVDVSWGSGGNTITVTASAISSETFEWQNHRSSTSYNGWNSIWSFVRDKPRVSVSFVLNLSTTDGPHDNGVLHIDLDTNGIKWSNESVENHSHVSYNGKGEEIQRKMARNLNDVLPTMIENLQAKLNTAGRFVFPGNGVFSFQNPLVTRYGHLITEVYYKPLHPDEKYFVPRPPKVKPNTGRPPPQEEDKTPVNHSTDDKWRLTWTVNEPKIQAANMRHKIVLRGQNDSDTLRCDFEKIKIDFPSNKRGTGLFTEDKWSTTPGADGGVITMRQSLERSHDVAVVQGPTKVGPGFFLVLDTDKNRDGTLRIGPKDWVEIEFDGILGGPKEYSLKIAENWANEKVRTSHKDSINIGVEASQF